MVVLPLPDRHGLSPQTAAEETGLATPTASKALESRFGQSGVIAYLGQRLGGPFVDLWRNHPNHDAA